MYFQVSGCTPSRHHFDYHASSKKLAFFYVQILGIPIQKCFFRAFHEPQTNPTKGKLKNTKS